MNVTEKLLKRRWQESEFELALKFNAHIPSRGPLEHQLEELKNRLLEPVLDTVAGANAVLARELSWAANEAAALAWFTFCPILVLPALLEEKIAAALKRWEKQEQLLHRSACS